MSFHFASSDYAASFQGVPLPDDIPSIRQSAVDYLENFDPRSWYDDPVRQWIENTETMVFARSDESRTNEWIRGPYRIVYFFVIFISHVVVWRLLVVWRLHSCIIPLPTTRLLRY